MGRFLTRFSEPVSSAHTPSWADFITQGHVVPIRSALDYAILPTDSLVR
jgi:hypothetical protein